MGRRRTVRSFVQELGDPPECIGHYEVGDEECDGGPCSWRHQCSAYQTHAVRIAALLDVDVAAVVEAEKASLPDWLFQSIVIRLFRTAPPQGMAGEHDPRHHMGWTLFLRALEECNVGVPIHSMEGLARVGELYWFRKGRARSIAVRTSEAKGNIPLLRYIVGRDHMALIEPSIEMRLPVYTVLDNYPEITAAAFRWRGTKGPKGLKRLGATAVKVQLERVPDMARLFARLLTDSRIPGVTVEKPLLVVDVRQARGWRIRSKWTVKNDTR